MNVEVATGTTVTVLAEMTNSFADFAFDGPQGNEKSLFPSPKTPEQPAASEMCSSGSGLASNLHP